jgi:5'-phosphate synthase pdxT subunit
MALKIGILAFQGSVSEHLSSTKKAAKELKIPCSISLVRTKNSLENLDGLIIPGGESTTLSKLCSRENMLEPMKEINNIFGTCAGAIMLAKEIQNKEEGQQTLSIMNIEIDRNAYGRQADSFEGPLSTKLGALSGIFIRAPRITKVGKGVEILASRNGETVACAEYKKNSFYMAACFHPELSSTAFHKHFLKTIK